MSQEMWLATSLFERRFRLSQNGRNNVLGDLIGYLRAWPFLECHHVLLDDVQIVGPPCVRRFRLPQNGRNDVSGDLNVVTSFWTTSRSSVSHGEFSFDILLNGYAVDLRILLRPPKMYVLTVEVHHHTNLFTKKMRTIKTSRRWRQHALTFDFCEAEDEVLVIISRTKGLVSLVGTKSRILFSLIKKRKANSRDFVWIFGERGWWKIPLFTYVRSHIIKRS